jgi:Spirocyclase AveC-like
MALKSAQTPAIVEKRWNPVQAAAAVGVALALFEVYIFIRWVTGPNFQEVTSGPSVPPGWMAIGIRAVEIIGPIGGLILIWKFVIAPWRRDRRIPLDGQLVIGSLAISLFDATSNYFRPWFTYNSYFFNLGNPTSELPGWVSWHEPGAQTAWPILFIVPLYPVFFLGIPMLICWIMRRVRNRFPGVPTVALIALAFVTVFVIDALLEGCVIMRMGWYEHSGWSFPFLDSYYGHNALRNISLVALTITTVSCLRFFVNDRGETFIERGASRLGTVGAKVNLTRMFAVYGAILTIIMLCYHIPMALISLASPDVTWHPSVVDNSYLNNHLCGFGTSRHCPPN